MIAKRRFGQNFLVDRGVIGRMIEAFDPKPDQTVMEIGPGRGALTSDLINRAGRVIAIEFDRDLAYQLRDKFAAVPNLALIEGDALTINFCEAIQPAPAARVIANLPYNVGTAILQRLIEQRSCISDMTLMLQREVVDRIMAQPGSSERGYLYGRPSAAPAENRGRCEGQETALAGRQRGLCASAQDDPQQSARSA